MPDTASHASTRRQARTDGGGGEKESSVPELCSRESVCGQACVYRHIARCVFTTIFINHGIVDGTSVQNHLNFILFVFFLTCSLSIVLSFCLLRAVLAFSYTSGGCQVMVLRGW